MSPSPCLACTSYQRSPGPGAVHAPWKSLPADSSARMGCRNAATEAMVSLRSSASPSRRLRRRNALHCACLVGSSANAVVKAVGVLEFLPNMPELNWLY